LTIAATRVAALGRVHCRLHLLDHQDHVEFKRYLEHLCEDLSRLLCEESGDCTIRVEGASAEIPTVFAIPLGFIANEPITNSVKCAKGDITVRFETMPPGCHSLLGVGWRAGIAGGLRSWRQQRPRNDDCESAGEADRRRAAHRDRG
jgi:two-component system, sensor histidine kinase PdtaS